MTNDEMTARLRQLDDKQDDPEERGLLVARFWESLTNKEKDDIISNMDAPEITGHYARIHHTEGTPWHSPTCPHCGHRPSVCLETTARHTPYEQTDLDAYCLVLAPVSLRYRTVHHSDGRRGTVTASAHVDIQGAYDVQPNTFFTRRLACVNCEDCGEMFRLDWDAR